MKPTYTLHKLPQGYVLTSDEDPNNGDIVKYFDGIYRLKDRNLFNLDTGEWVCMPNRNSTKHPFLKVIAQDFDFSALSPKEQKEIGWFDVEKLADNFYRNYQQPPYVMEKGAWRLGFQKAQELLSDRRFTLEDMENAFYNGWIYRGEGYDFPRAKKEYLQQLSQPKSWEVLGIWENNKFKITQIIG